MATVIGHVLVDQASWRRVFYGNLPMGVAALAGLALTFPAGDTEGPSGRSTLAGAALLRGGHQRLDARVHLGRRPLRLGLARVLGLIGGTVLLAVALVAREQRAGDPIVPFALLRTRTRGDRGRGPDGVPGGRAAGGDRAAVVLALPELPLRTNDNQKEHFMIGPMTEAIALTDLPGSERSRCFDGEDHGTVVSFFLMDYSKEGQRPELHRDAYDEIFRRRRDGHDVVLLTPEEVDAAAKRSADYRPPGS